MKYPADNISLQEGFELFVDDCECTNLSPRTISTYQENMQRFHTFLVTEKHISEPTVSDFSAENFRAYIKYLRSEDAWGNHPTHGSKHKPKSPHTIQTYVRSLKVVAKWLYNQNYHEEDISFLIRLPNAPRVRKEILTAEHIETVLALFDEKTMLGLRNKIIFLLAVDIGIRQGGIAHLCIRDVNFRERQIHVRLKGGNTTILAIGTTILRYLREYMTRYRRDAKPDEPLLIDQAENGVTENAIKKMFSQMRKKTGIEQLSCHRCRHTFATNFVRDGRHSVTELQQELCHATPKMAQQYIQDDEIITRASRSADSFVDRLMMGKGRVIRKKHHKLKTKPKDGILDDDDRIQAP